MIKWFKKSKDLPAANNPAQDAVVTEKENPQLRFYDKLKRSLTKTREQLGEGFFRILAGKKVIDADLLEQIETLLLSADFGVETTQSILDAVHEGLDRKALTDGDTVLQWLRVYLEAMLKENSQPLNPVSTDKDPFVILMVGVNGAGKTTSIGKLAHQFQLQGKKVMLAAGDTFRAAAVEQLQIWGTRNHIPVIAQHTGADSASVVFDAFQAAKARGMDILIADTAGRLHTQGHLMEELQKVKRVLQKINPQAPHEIMLVLDASIGQNGLNQAREFQRAIGLTGIIMTKLDGTAKGGVLFSLANALKVPFRYIGVGESMDDLRVFDSSQFVKAIFNDD